MWEAKNGFILNELGWKAVHQQRSRGLKPSERKPSFSEFEPWCLIGHLLQPALFKGNPNPASEILVNNTGSQPARSKLGAQK